MIKEIKKIYSIKITKFDAITKDKIVELIKFTNATHYQCFYGYIKLYNIRTGNDRKRHIRINRNHYLVKDEESGNIYTVPNIKSLVDNIKKGELSIEDEDLMKEFISDYKQLED